MSERGQRSALGRRWTYDVTYLVYDVCMCVPSELAAGGCMSDYTWNKGGRHKKKDWTDKLPTDAAVSHPGVTRCRGLIVRVCTGP